MLKRLKAINFERPSLVFSAGDKLRGSLVFDGSERTLTIYDEFISIPRASRADTPFELDLPETLWSTFIGGLGYTVYRLVFFGRPNSPLFFKESLLCLSEIVIIGLSNPAADAFTAQFNEMKEFASKSGELAKLTVSMNQTCASPGDTVSLSVNIENGLRLPLGSVKMVFQQLFSRQMKDQEVIILVHKEGPLIPPGPRRNISWNCTFLVPHTVPTNMGADGCKFIKLSYCIIVTVAKFVNLQIIVPIHIGTSVFSDPSDFEEVSLAYKSQLQRSLSEQSLASWATSDNASSSCWSLMDGTESESGDDSISVVSTSSSTRPPSYNSEWKFAPIETRKALNT
ncbi:uncharacterized protein LOC110842363 isoform X1 [Folsomia candida]|uniref:uncharacterized protein LOC110842363 isoform X1 n=1 Tax=Folsomia candida TaxID=158441 RepID=UPI001604DDD1|nr:uncharacterized protein LOC110842363 isoform X1 [Folsomia candida]